MAPRQFSLSYLTGETVRAYEFSDDRLEMVLRHLSDETRWTAFESTLNQHLIRVYDLKAERQATVEVRVDEAALESAVARLGWRMYGTNPPSDELSLEQAVLAYRRDYMEKPILDFGSRYWIVRSHGDGNETCVAM